MTRDEIIAAAFDRCRHDNMDVKEPSKAEQRIVGLSHWLRAHPEPSTPWGRRARADRERNLDRWIEIAQRQKDLIL